MPILYRHFSNLMRPLINAKNFFPLNISAVTNLPISDFLIIKYGTGQICG